jgi:serine protease Do
MAQQAIEVRRPVAALLTAAVLVVGILAGLGVAAWAGHPVFGAQKTVPVFMSGPSLPAVAAPAGSMGYASILKPALSAVVNISTSKVVKTPQNAQPFGPFFNDPFFRQFFGNQFHGSQMPREQRERSLGSGVIVGPDGYIVTNNHVIDGANEIKVFLPDKRQFKGKVIGTDSKTDIAVIKIEAKNLPALAMGDSSKIQVGDLAFAIGDPFGIGETATMGIVSAKGRNGLDIEDYEDFIQTDAAINPGNSGGALVDARGELIGINTAILAGGGGGNQGIGFAIPINLARRVMEDIMKNGKVVRGYLGVVIQEVTPDLAKAFKAPEGKGALIGDVTPGGPGDKAGLRKGDVIEQLNGEPVNDINSLRLQIASMAPGTVAHLKILRNAQERAIDVTLGELPSKSASSTPGSLGEGNLMQGVQVETLTPSIAQDIGVQPGTKGVVVTSVDSDSPASDAGLQRGDVIEQINRQPVTDVTDYDRLVREAGKQTLVLLVNRAGQTSFVVVQPE